MCKRTYMQKQLERIDAKNCDHIDKAGVKTNWLNLTPEQFERMKELLIEMKGDE